MRPLNVMAGFCSTRKFAMALEWVVYGLATGINNVQHRVGQAKCLIEYLQVLAHGGAAIGVHDHDCLSRPVQAGGYVVGHVNQRRRVTGKSEIYHALRGCRKSRRLGLRKGKPVRWVGDVIEALSIEVTDGKTRSQSYDKKKLPNKGKGTH